MKLFKFRSLANCRDLDRAKQILETGEFWCSQFWELNDPMEGVYSFNAGALRPQFIQDLYGEKSRHAICSFSGAKAFGNPIMWGYYANGFKGIAIEIEVDGARCVIKRVNYTSEIAKITNGDPTGDTVQRILTTKLCCWEHEDEYRHLRRDDSGPCSIGRITAIYFGSPYKTTVNAKDAQRRPRVRKYLCRVESLKDIAMKKCIAFHEVDVVDGSVQSR